MEMEWFCQPEEAQLWYQFWKEERMKWWLSLGIDAANLIYRDHDEDELAHYSNACVDIEYRYPFTSPGFGELEGIAHRGNFDLNAHQTHSRTKLEYFDQAAQLAAKDAGLDKDEVAQKSRYMPHVIEPASGLTRALLTVLCEAFTPDETRPSKVLMKFKPSLAPIKAAIFPLINKEGLPEIAQGIYESLRHKYTLQFDTKQSIGKRYARMDEAGTPFCFTVDGDSPSDHMVTVRDRDSAAQTRIAIDSIDTFLAEKLAS
jgi:glycyl-tRNA synthetase